MFIENGLNGWLLRLLLLVDRGKKREELVRSDDGGRVSGARGRPLVLRDNALVSRCKESVVTSMPRRYYKGWVQVNRTSGMIVSVMCGVCDFVIFGGV